VAHVLAVIAACIASGLPLVKQDSLDYALPDCFRHSRCVHCTLMQLQLTYAGQVAQLCTPTILVHA
jgi:hypothetical protein